MKVTLPWIHISVNSATVHLLLGSVIVHYSLTLASASKFISKFSNFDPKKKIQIELCSFSSITNIRKDN